MRRFVWMTLQAAGVLTLTACFTIIDFDLGEAGGAGTGGLGNGGVPGVGGFASVGGNGSVGGAGGEGGAPSCGCGTAACVGDVCQAEELATTDGTVVLVAAGGGYVATMDDSSLAPLTFFPVDVQPMTQDGTVVFGSNPWNALGTSLALSPDGVAYYSPQGANTTQLPVEACTPDACSQVFFIAGQTSHLNGVTTSDSRVYAIHPGGQAYLSSLADDDTATKAFKLVTATNGPMASAHDVAVGGDVVLASQQGSGVQSDLACIGAGTEGLLLVSEAKLTCNSVASTYSQVLGLAVSPDGHGFARAQRKASGKTVTLAVSVGNIPSSPYADFTLVAGENGSGIAADLEHVYFFANGDDGTHLYRCDVESDSASCVSVSEALPGAGPIASTDGYVFFGSANKLYRVMKSP